ncbi:MAG: MATE family efflux transporter [Lachnospiraceae bacterium]|nr:MATE family efflux transporter [Lachnospiraceae bacterium]
MSKAKEVNFTEGKIALPLIKFVFPIMFAMLIQSLYGAVDLLIVGQFSDPANVSAVSTGAQIMHSITVVISELAIGTTITLGQMIGQGRRDACGKVVGATIFTFSIMGIVVAVLMQPLAAPVASLLNAPAEAFAQTVSYVRICCGGAVFIVAYNILGSIFRGIGDAKMPLITVLIAAIFNIFGDLFFVGYMGIGAAGAAIATVMAQALSVILSFVIIRRRGMPFPFRLSDIGFHKEIIGRVLVLGIPIALQDFLVSISFLIIMAIVNNLGVIASAGVGVAERLCGFIMLLPSAFSQATSSFVAQNYGARKMDRAGKALRYAIGISFCCSVVIFYLAFFHGVALSHIFSKDMEVCVASAEYLKAYAIDCMLTSFLFCFIGYFNGCSRTTFVMIQGIVGAFCVRVPLSFLFSHIQPVSIFRIGLATPSSTFVQIILCFTYLWILRRQMQKKENAEA